MYWMKAGFERDRSYTCPKILYLCRREDIHVSDKCTCRILILARYVSRDVGGMCGNGEIDSERQTFGFHYFT